MQDRHIVIVIGPEPAFEIDLNIFDAVKEITGTPYTRLMQPTLQDFIEQMRLIRTQTDRRIDCHIAAHMNPDAITFAGASVNAETLSVHLTGVDHLMLAGCKSTRIGAALPVVPYVVTLLEEVENAAANSFSQVFWIALNAGYTAEDAFDRACYRLPDVARFAWLHDHRFLARKRI